MKTEKKILLVEDDRDFAESLKLLLQMKGFSVVAVASGEEAIDLHPSGHFSFVLMDIKLPGISGVDALNAILEQAPSAKVLLMTGCERGSDEVMSANRAGAISVLYKPFRINDLLKIIDNQH